METWKLDAAGGLEPDGAVHETTLDEQRLDHLFSEVAGRASAQVFFRDGRPSSLAPGADVLALAAAREALRKQTTSGIQLRYRHEDGERWDTLTPEAPGARLVRLSFARENGRLGLSR